MTAAADARPLLQAGLPDGRRAAFLPLDLAHLRVFLASVAPFFAPRAPDGPGLGIGCRMGILDLPESLSLVRRHGLQASVVQSSVYRELAPLSQLSGAQRMEIELPGVGTVPLGHTGSSITGQFVSMAAEKIRMGDRTPFTADADHIPLRGDSPEDLDLASRLIRESADRSMFTLDPHFCLYGGDAALARLSQEGADRDRESAFEERLAAGRRRDLLARYADREFPLPAAAGLRLAVGRQALIDCALRFEAPLRAVREACGEVARARAGRPYSIEVSVDEIPGMSDPVHFLYLSMELRRLEAPLFSLAPGLGFSKRDEDVDTGAAFTDRVRVLAAIAATAGTVLGVHSGDGKGGATRRALRRAAGPRIWYKISPDRQRSFFRALFLGGEGSGERELFAAVYGSSLRNAVRMAAAAPAFSAAAENARVARDILSAVRRGPGLSARLGEALGRSLEDGAWERMGSALREAGPGEIRGCMEDGIVHNYAFAAVGQRDAAGGFSFRDGLYGVSREALARYRAMDRAYLEALVSDLGFEAGGR